MLDSNEPIEHSSDSDGVKSTSPARIVDNKQGCGAACPTGLSIKRSYGIICCRRSEGTLEALCIRKKYTYAFADFIHGKYTSSTSPIIQKYLNNMTSEEKYAIMSMNFEQIYARIWKKNDVFHMQKHRAKFMNTFGTNPRATAHLMHMISKSSQYITEWELPKGHRAERGAALPLDPLRDTRGSKGDEVPLESDLDCAIREFKEETNMTPADYSIIPGFLAKHEFICGRVKYVYTFYLAIVKDDRDTTPTLDLCGPQGSEVAEIAWCDVMALRNTKIESVAKRAFSYVKKYVTI